MWNKYADHLEQEKTTVSVLLFILLQINRRTLTCAPASIAILQLASYVLSFVEESFQTKIASGDSFQFFGMKHAILIGDECQLPATVTSNVCIESGFGRSLFDRLSYLGHSKHLLNIQYRMHPSISCFPNRIFYQNQILNAENVLCKSYEKQYLSGPMFGSIHL